VAANPQVGAVSAALRMGLVGAGRLAERAYVAAFALAAGVDLVAIADPVLERCRQVAPAALACPDVDVLLDDGNVEAIVIASPAEHHVAQTRAACARGVPVLVEKPPAPDLAGARDLVGTAVGGPWLGLNRRFEPGIARLRSRIDGREVVSVQTLFHARSSDWDAHVVADDALLDLGPHCIDLVRWLSGAEVRRVRAAPLSAAGGRLELDLDRSVASVEVSHRAAYREAVEVVLADGRRLGWARPGGHATRLLARRRGGDPLVRSLARQLEAFAAVVGGGEPGALASAADGTALMSAIAAARASAQSGGAWAAAVTARP
jgi:predicted dehydrogenase